MTAEAVSLTPLPGLPLVRPGDDLAGLLIEAIERAALTPRDGDVLAVAQKVVSKAEGRDIALAAVTPSPRARALAVETGKDARLIEVILGESSEILRRREGLIIAAHRLGHVMANAGVDHSNVEDAGERVLLLPCDADASAAALKARLDGRFAVRFGVVICDSAGRAWRRGVVGLALGAAGVPALLDLVGRPDLFDRRLEVTEVAVADALAAAAVLVMGEAAEGRPAVLVRGLALAGPALPAAALVRPREQDLFR